MATNTNPTRSSKGRQNRPNNATRGAMLEDALRWQHHQYAANNRALVWQNGVKSIVRRGTVVQLPSLPDFGGILTTIGGKYCSFDSKLIAAGKGSNNGKSTAITYRHPSDRMHQLSTLWNVQEAGGIAF